MKRKYINTGIGRLRFTTTPSADVHGRFMDGFRIGPQIGKIILRAPTWCIWWREN